MWYNTSDMKKASILFAAFLAMISGSALAETVYEVRSSTDLSKALSYASSAAEAVVIKLYNIITPTAQISLLNKISTEPISFIGPAVLGNQPIVISATTPIVFRDVTIEGKVTIGSGKVTFIDCTLNGGVDKKGGEVIYESDTSESSAFPDDLVILPSSQRQVYFGFSSLKGATSIAVEKSVDGLIWQQILAEDLDWRDANSSEPTVVGWNSFRYLNATPGETAQYRLVATMNSGAIIQSFAMTITTASAGALHSRPNAKATIYLDFDGYVDDYSANASAAHTNHIETIAYNKRDEIYKIWRSVAEDFAIFDVDVTTEEPTIDKLVKSDADDEIYGKRVVFDRRTGLNKWYTGAGGVSGLGAFGFKADRPSFIFGEETDNVACQATHEVSHTLGLAHDGGEVIVPVGSEVYDPDTGKMVVIEEEYTIPSEYYSGQKVSLNCFWYPVMGGVPTRDGADYINQFSNGNYVSATNNEDDFAVITGKAVGAHEGNVVVFPKSLYPDEKEDGFWKLNLLPDDVGNEVLSSTPYTGVRMALISPEDLDVFSISAKAGELTIKVSPEYEGSSYGSSLDAKVELLDASGIVLVSSQNPLQGDKDNGEFRKAELKYPLAQDGVYYIRVSGTYHDVKYCANTNYGSVGPYKLTADYTAGERVKGLGAKAPRIIVR